MWFTRISIKNPVLATMPWQQGAMPPCDPPKSGAGTVHRFKG
jgi:hypothetical protein